MARVLTFAVCLSASLAVCTSVYAERAGGVSGAIAQPFRDLGVLRQRPDDVLKHAAAAPYEMPSVPSDDPLYCTTIEGELTSLNLALGLDVDVRQEQRTTAGSLASGAISSAIGGVIDLPYRSVIRRITGAERRDRALQRATQAGMVRRAFLKGLSMRDCTNAQHAPQTTPVSAPAAPQAAPITQIAAIAAPVERSAEPVPTPVAVVHVAPAQTGAALQTVADVTTPAG